MRYYQTLNILVIALAVCIQTVLAQDELDTVITDPNGNVITIPASAEYVIDNPQDEALRTFIVTPREESGLASTQIKRGDELTKISGKKITYTPVNERFLLEGDAQIETGTELLKGPKLIQFDPDKNYMLVEGTDKQWAEFRYEFPDGRVMHSFGKKFEFYFEMVDGKRKLKRVVKS
jgi:hypothetical protein